MAKHPDDNTTPDMFGPIERTTGHSMIVGDARSGKALTSVLLEAVGHPSCVLLPHGDPMDRVRRFRKSRKLFPASSNVACEVCGKKHDGDCRVRK